MTWALSFEVKDNKIDAESVRVSGEMPAGQVSLYGHQSEVGKSLSAAVAGLAASASSYARHEAIS